MAPPSRAGLQSMTGFARGTGAGSGVQWVWEIRSVNGKGLDVRFRGPPGMERLEQVAREQAASRFTRGSIQLGLTIRRNTQGSTIRVNRPALEELVQIVREFPETEGRSPSVERLMAIRGIVDITDEETEASDEVLQDIITTLREALDQLMAMRRAEGEAVAAILSSRLDQIEILTSAARANPARAPEAIRARLSAQLALLLDETSTLDVERLHQEAALLAIRADIAEEVDRLTAHVLAARELMAIGGAVGRRLDFLAQEFNREANTLCSKSNDRSLTAIGLDLKATVDQFREQVQNLE